MYFFASLDYKIEKIEPTDVCYVPRKYRKKYLGQLPERIGQCNNDESFTATGENGVCMCRFIEMSCNTYKPLIKLRKSINDVIAMLLVYIPAHLVLKLAPEQNPVNTVIK